MIMLQSSYNWNSLLYQITRDILHILSKKHFFQFEEIKFYYLQTRLNMFDPKLKVENKYDLVFKQINNNSTIVLLKRNY